MAVKKAGKKVRNTFDLVSCVVCDLCCSFGAVFAVCIDLHNINIHRLAFGGFHEQEAK